MIRIDQHTVLVHTPVVLTTSTGSSVTAVQRRTLHWPIPNSAVSALSDTSAVEVKPYPSPVIP
jgi:hypothetical protein